MKQFTSIEIGGLILAGFLFFGGLVVIIWPQAGIVPHFTNDALGMPSETSIEVTSITGGRIYGILAMLLGVGIVWNLTRQQ
jgi:hypothetical protein